jgi:hypothetical protein
MSIDTTEDVVAYLKEKLLGPSNALMSEALFE